MGYRTQHFKHLWRHSCLSLRMHHKGSCTKSSNCSDKIKMSKSTTGCWIKSFIPVENKNVKKFRATKSNINIFSQVSIKWIQKSASISALHITTWDIQLSSLIILVQPNLKSINFLQCSWPSCHHICINRHVCKMDFSD